MAALKWVCVIVSMVLMSELGSSLRVLNEKDKVTYKPNDLGSSGGPWSLGDLPSIQVGPGGISLGFGNGKGGETSGSGSASIHIGPGGIWIPGFSIPGIGQGGSGCGSGCSCNSCRTCGGSGCTDNNCGINGIFGSHGGNSLTPLIPSTLPVQETIIPATPVGNDSQNKRADKPTKVAAGHD